MDAVPERGILHSVEKEKITVRDLTVHAGSCVGIGRNFDKKLGKFGTYFGVVSKLRIKDLDVLHACAYESKLLSTSGMRSLGCTLVLDPVHLQPAY